MQPSDEITSLVYKGGQRIEQPHDITNGVHISTTTPAKKIHANHVLNS